MKFQRIKTNPLKRMTRPDSAHDGKPVRWRGENPPPLPDGQKWVPIEERPESIPEGHKVVRFLTLEKDGWEIIPLSQEELDAIEETEEDQREAEILSQVIPALQAGEGTGTQRIRRLERFVLYLSRQMGIRPPEATPTRRN